MVKVTSSASSTCGQCSRRSEHCSTTAQQHSSTRPAGPVEQAPGLPSSRQTRARSSGHTAHEPAVLLPRADVAPADVGLEGDADHLEELGEDHRELWMWLTQARGFMVE